MLWYASVLVAKTALVLQIMRIFAPAKAGKIYWASLLLMGANAIWLVTCFFMSLFQCVPITKSWRAEEPGVCNISFPSLQIASGILNVLSDILLFALPIWTVLQLNLRTKRKFTVGAVFSIGLL